MSLSIGYCGGENVPPSLPQILPPDRYELMAIEDLSEDLLPDCLVVFDGKIPPFNLPIVVVGEGEPDHDLDHLHPDQIYQLPRTIETAIARFLSQNDREQARNKQQLRLSDKLKERLGYLGVYYKRNPDQFLRVMSPEDRRNYLDKLAQTYKLIIAEYFKESPDRLNQKIDEFASMAFLADVSVSQVLEIHVNLMDELSKQLRIEGHKDEILLDYRITLIDVIAHLCEMYRRSIPPKVSAL